MAAKFKLNLDALCAEHERIGKHLAAARDSVTEGGSYKLKLNGVRDAHARIGQMISDAFESMAPRGGTASDDMNPRGASSGVRGMDALVPEVDRLNLKRLGDKVVGDLDRLSRNR
jgi:hypothetical protein